MKSTVILLAFCGLMSNAFSQTKIDLPIKTMGAINSQVSFRLASNGSVETSISNHYFSICNSEGNELPIPKKFDYDNIGHGLFGNDYHYIFEETKTGYDVLKRRLGTFEFKRISTGMKPESRSTMKCQGVAEGNAYLFVVENLFDVSKKKPVITMIKISESDEITTSKLELNVPSFQGKQTITDIEYLGKLNGNHVIALGFDEPFPPTKWFYAILGDNSADFIKFPEVTGKSSPVAMIRESVEESDRFFGCQTELVKIPDARNNDPYYTIRYTVYEYNSELKLTSHVFDIPKEVLSAYSSAGPSGLPELTTYRIGDKRVFGFVVRESTYWITQDSEGASLKSVGNFKPSTPEAYLILENEDLMNQVVKSPYSEKEENSSSEWHSFPNQFCLALLDSKGELKQATAIRVLYNKNSFKTARAVSYKF